MVSEYSEFPDRLRETCTRLHSHNFWREVCSAWKVNCGPLPFPIKAKKYAKDSIWHFEIDPNLFTRRGTRKMHGKLTA